MGKAYSYVLLYRIFLFALLNSPIIFLKKLGARNGFFQEEKDTDRSCPHLRVSGENRSDSSVGSPWSAEGTQRSQPARRF
jgi:hypothetical protein